MADRVGTSLQNAAYHLDRLLDAGLVTVIETWYSAKGKEMDVYAPATEPLVLFVGGVSSKRAVSQAIVALE